MSYFQKYYILQILQIPLSIFMNHALLLAQITCHTWATLFAKFLKVKIT